MRKEQNSVYMQKPTTLLNLFNKNLHACAIYRLCTNLASPFRNNAALIIFKLSALCFDPACSGTPVQNNMAEVFSLMNMLCPELYSTLKEFAERFGGDTEPSTAAQIEDLQV